MIDEIPNVLACDVGNAAIHLAHVCGEQVAGARTFRTGELSPLGEAISALWREIPEPRKVAAGSVNPAGLKALEAAVADALGEDVLAVGRELPLPIATDLPAPDAVGVDRLCAAAAAFDRLGVACIVADFGTAVTVDCVSDEGVFLGGAILPGVHLAARSLADGTAQLPLVTPCRPDWAYGRDTREAIIGGLVYGLRGALRGLVEAYATRLGHWPLVIATGGDAELICNQAGESDLIQAVVPDLVLRGVAMAYYKSLLK